MTRRGIRSSLRELSALGRGGTVVCGSRRAVGGLLAFYALSVVMMGLTRVLPSVFTVPFVVLSLTFVPGSLLIVALERDEFAVGAAHVLYAFGASLVVLMLVGALVNVGLPAVGVARPLMPVPLGAGVSVTVLALAGVASWANPTGAVTVRVPAVGSPVALGLFSLPLVSILGVNVLNLTGSNALLLVALLTIAVVPLFAVLTLEDRWYPFAVWTVALAVLYHKSLWQYAGFGGRPHGIAAWEAGRWSPGVVDIDPYSSELLQNGVLFPLFARLSDLFIMTQYEVVNPFLVSFLPLALYVTFRQYVNPQVALLGAAVFTFVHPFYLQYPWAGRAATPVVFLALFGVALANEDLAPGPRAGLGVTFLLGVVVTHYGTSYFVAAAFALALGCVAVLRVGDRVVTGLGSGASAATDGGAASPDDGREPPSTIFSPTTVVFFVAAALGWYLYTRQGWKFELLPKHVNDNLRSLLSGSTGGGRTTARVQETYTSTSIQVSKYIYILIALLILVGFAAVYYRRIVDGESSFDDHYLSIATALFAIFGTTTILSNWGGGRPMMITFSFTTVFAVLGVVWLTRTLGRLVRWTLGALARDGSGSHQPAPEDHRIAVSAFAVLLVVFFTLNSGVAAATVFDGQAPSNVPIQSDLVSNQGPNSQVTVHRETDIVTHVWLVRHLDEGYATYGDTYAARQYDWYRPAIAARTPAVGGGYTPATKPTVFDVDAQRRGTQPGYILVMGHNDQLDAVWPGKFADSVRMTETNIERRDRLYTNGESHVYFYREAAGGVPDGGGEDD